MFGIGMPELLVILVVALVVLGPQRLPELARTLGKAMAEFRRQTSDLMDEFQGEAMREDEPARRPARAVPPATSAPAVPEATAAPTAPVAPGDKPKPGDA